MSNTICYMITYCNLSHIYKHLKIVATNHDPLAQIAHSSQSHASPLYSYSPQPYYVTHPSSAIDSEEDYQRELQRDAQEDKLTTTMMLLAQAITRKFSAPTSNRLRTSSNTRNHDVINDVRANVQCYNCNARGYYSCDYLKPKVCDAKYFREQMLVAMKDEAGGILNDEENDFMLDNAYGDETLEELIVTIIIMARIQPAYDNAKTKPKYDAEAVSEVNTSHIDLISSMISKGVHEHANHEIFKTVINISDDDQIDCNIIFNDPYVENNGQSIQTIHMFGKRPTKVYDTFLKVELGYQNLERLKKATASQPKMYDGERLYSMKLIVDSLDSEETLEDAKETKSRNLGATSVVAKSKFSVAKTPTATNKVIQLILWIVDSGCSKHMTGNLKLQRNSVEKCMVRLENDHFAQNGIVKRRNRTLVEAARTMLIFSKTLEFFWAEAIATAYFTQNHSLVHTRYNKTAFELIKRRKTNVQYFHVFKSLCYPTNDRDDLGKMKLKADVFSTWMAFGGNTRDLGSFREETDEITHMKPLHELGPETPLLVGRGFLATANAIIDCRMAKISVGEGITRLVFGVKGVDLGEEEAPYWTTLGKRESYKPRPRSDGDIARDAELNPFKDTLVFRRMVEFLGAIPINLKSNIWESEDLIDLINPTKTESEHGMPRLD
nr:retrovirus-related Pol polyprotein from transposon TNT 1-94 [Tanacetum cinerariifolium]